jgi:hypothetical protein
MNQSAEELGSNVDAVPLDFRFTSFSEKLS